MMKLSEGRRYFYIQSFWFCLILVFSKINSEFSLPKGQVVSNTQILTSLCDFFLNIIVLYSKKYLYIIGAIFLISPLKIEMWKLVKITIFFFPETLVISEIG